MKLDDFDNDPPELLARDASDDSDDDSDDESDGPNITHCIDPRIPIPREKQVIIYPPPSSIAYRTKTNKRQNQDDINVRYKHQQDNSTEENTQHLPSREETSTSSKDQDDDDFFSAQENEHTDTDSYASEEPTTEDKMNPPNAYPNHPGLPPPRHHDEIMNQYLIPTQVKQSLPRRRTRQRVQQKIPTPPTEQRYNSNLHYGDTSASKNPKNFRIYLQNPDGLSSKKQLRTSRRYMHQCRWSRN